MSEDIRKILEDVKNNRLSVEKAVMKLKQKPFEDIGYAHIDLHRTVRQGMPEVIFGEGKTPDQVIGIIRGMTANSDDIVMVTRMSKDMAAVVSASVPLQYFEAARIGIVGDIPNDKTASSIAVLTAGTSDYAVAEECAVTAECYGNTVHRLYDVGVAGIHRLLAHMDLLMEARVIVAIAGMEGALASVVGGLVSVPVIAVPTSVGYGTSFGGITALLSMLNSCASGVAVMNIDNGFGEGYLASMINHIGETS